MILSIPDFIGRCHPVLVHLPIGILVIACFFQWLVIKERLAPLKPAIPALLFWGMVSAVASCISGYLLAQSGDYGAQLVNQHQWMGIVTAIFSFILFIAHRLSVSDRIARWLSLVLLILITITGHLGGSLTHGADYLTAGLGQSTETGAGLKPIPNIQEAVVYADMVQPVLQAKCYSCHGPQKQKGKLRLDQPELILKGGEDGKAVVPGKPEESELIHRILLPLEDEDHMAPKEKPQLTQNEIALLQWWIKSGADFTKKTKDIPQDEKIKPVLAAFQNGQAEKKTAAITDVPEEPVKAADTAAIARLTRAGVMVMPVARNSNYLSVNFVTARAGADSLIRLLEPLQKQIVWLKLDQASITDASLAAIAFMKNLTRLQLSNTPITDEGIAQLASLPRLQSLNLVGTKITAGGLVSLQKIKALKNIYLYQTNITAAEWPQLVKAFPNARLDSGNYSIPFLATDTMRVTQ